MAADCTIHKPLPLGFSYYKFEAAFQGHYPYYKVVKFELKCYKAKTWLLSTTFSSQKKHKQNQYTRYTCVTNN